MAMNFDKAMYREKELLNLFSVPKSTFHRWVSQYIAQGYDPIDMGKITIGRNTWWDAYRFYEWMKFQSQNKPTYDYEVIAQREKKKAILVFHQTKKETLK